AGELNITIDANKQSGIFCVNEDCEVALNGLTLTGGYAEYYGAIFNLGTLTVTNSTFTGNSAGTGGAIINAGTLTVTDSTFTGNSSDAGGAIYSEGTCTITNSTFTENESYWGGAITNWGSLTITHTMFMENSAGEYAGGIINLEGKLTITDSTFIDNSAEGAGAVAIFDGACVITNSTFTGNSATRGGAIANGAFLMVTNTTLTKNTTWNGAAIDNSWEATIVNSIVTGNSGADIYSESGRVLYSYYSIIGDESLEFTQNVGTQLDVAAEDVFEYGEDGEIVLENGVPVISATGLAATTGTLVAGINGKFGFIIDSDYENPPFGYYVDKAAGAWRGFMADAASEMAFDATAADFGLTDGTVFTTAQNVDATGA
ncbi:MAG: right-handed parallel beta-helix repeat-containing protein, partial [Thermoguttaceae bacterium]|nr:right-handed parallel beta-helix repeat-containing protein [Thermoguttaceae bacterium]